MTGIEVIEFAKHAPYGFLHQIVRIEPIARKLREPSVCPPPKRWQTPFDDQVDGRAIPILRSSQQLERGRNLAIVSIRYVIVLTHTGPHVRAPRHERPSWTEPIQVNYSTHLQSTLYYTRPRNLLASRRFACFGLLGSRFLCSASADEPPTASPLRQVLMCEGRFATRLGRCWITHRSWPSVPTRVFR